VLLIAKEVCDARRLSLCPSVCLLVGELATLCENLTVSVDVEELQILELIGKI